MKTLSLACVVAGLLVAAAPARAADPPLDLERLTVAEISDEDGRRPAHERPGHACLHQPHRRGQRSRAGVERGPHRQSAGARRTRACSTSNAPPASSEARCTACPCWSRTISTSPACRRPRATSRWRTPFRQRDSTVVAKLRAAGAVILGKTNLTEFANFMSSTGMRNGYSSLGGQVLNPYDLDFGTSGSSAGSGSAAASGLAAITIGTETSGSIVSPSAMQSLVGLRPTVGLVSRTGILPISATQDTAGPMTRTVADAAAELQAIAGKDAEDPATDTAPAAVPDYLTGLTANALAGKRIGVINNTNAQYVAAVAAVQALGATTVQIAAPTSTAPYDVLDGGVPARHQRLPRPAARERADEVARRHHRLQQRACRRGAEVRPGPAHAEPGDRPQRPGARTPPTRPPATPSAPPPAPRSTTR